MEIQTLKINLIESYAEFRKAEIIRLADGGDFNGLLYYSHILKLKRLKETITAPESLDDMLELGLFSLGIFSLDGIQFCIHTSNFDL